MSKFVILADLVVILQLTLVTLQLAALYIQHRTKMTVANNQRLLRENTQITKSIAMLHKGNEIN